MATHRIAYLGDSLGDSDEFWSLAEQILVDPLPDPKYYAHQFSNGEVQTDVITRLLGAEGADPASGQDYNYAVGGARAVGPLTAGDFIDDDHVLRDDVTQELLDTRIDLSAQTDRFLADATAHGWDLSSFTAHMLIGINDLSNWEAESPWPWKWDDEIDALVEDIIASIELNVQTLLAADIGAVWVGTQPDETFFPIYNELDDLMKLLSDGVIDDLNDGLVSMVAALDDDRVRILDLEEMTDQIEEDPLNFGRVNLEDPILLGKGGDYDPQLNPDLPDDFDFAADANDYGFLDSVHPTEGTHRILGIFQAEVMEGNLISGSTGVDHLTGTEGDDIVLAGRNDDVVALGGGDDVAIGGMGHDTVDGDAGSDLISGGIRNDTIRGGIGNDLLTGGYGDDQVDGGPGEDVLIDTAGSDRLAGGDGNDFILWFDGALAGASQGPDAIEGGEGTDTLIFYLADTATYDAALDDYSKASKGGGKGGGKNKDASISLSSLDVTVSSDVETVEFLDLSVDALELPDTGNGDLVARMDEWQYWDFA